MARPFEGIRVVDFSQVLSGPYLTLQLALQGADVVKVEPPAGGDQMRNRMLPSPLADRNMAAAFLSLNHGKRSIALDLKHPRGLEIAFELIKGADVMVHNFRGGVIERLGLSWDACRAVNPRLVYCQLSGYGVTGPKAREAAYDGAIQAVAGMMANNGHPETGPTRTGYFPVDMATGLTGAFAVASALMRRARDGVGQALDVSMQEVALGLVAPSIGQWSVDGNPGGLIGNSSATHTPTSDSFPTADGDILISAPGQNHVEALFREAGLAALLDDPRFADTKARVANKEAVRAAMIEAFKSDNATNWARRLGAAGVPVSRVNSIADAIEDEQLEGRNGVMEVPPPTGFDAPMRLPGAAFRADADGPRPGRPTPLLGEHGREVLAELGLSGDAIDALVADGVVALPATP